MFDPYLKSFYVRSNDPTNIRLLKVHNTLISIHTYCVIAVRYNG